MRRQADTALEQAERMNELLARVVKLTEPMERAQRGGEYVAEGLKRAIFGAEAGIASEHSRRQGSRRTGEASRGAGGGSRGGGGGRGRAVSRPDAGLCDRCRHQRVIRNTRGSGFSLCERSKTDPDFPRYPRLPVTSCRGFQQRARGNG